MGHNTWFVVAVLLLYRSKILVIMLPLTTSTIVIQLQQFRYYASLCTVQVHSEFKIKILGQDQVYCEDLRLLTLKTKIWHNNVLSRRFGKYSFVHETVSELSTKLPTKLSKKLSAKLFSNCPIFQIISTILFIQFQPKLSQK